MCQAIDQIGVATRQEYYYTIKLNYIHGNITFIFMKYSLCNQNNML